MTPLDSFDEAEPGFSGHFSANFRAAVTTALQEQGYTVLAWEEDGVNVIGPQADEQYLGLNNLYRRALGLDQAEWPLLIRQFLEHVTHISGGPDLPAALDTVTAQLRPRLVTPFSSDLKPRLWSRPLPGTPLIISLVIDFPHAMAYATQEMVENSQATPDELLESALDNLRQDTPDDFLQPVTEELDLLLGHTGDGYDASRALLVEELLPEPAPAGLWVTVPSRDELYVWPVSAAALEHLPHLKLFAQDNYQKHAYPISDDIFWIYQGRWHTFDIRFEKPDTVAISPPPEFIELLENWSASGELP